MITFAVKNDPMKNQVLDFLAQLVENNNREWFQRNRKQYEDAKKEFESFINMVIPEIAKFDDSVKFVVAKDCMFRIFRDVRFASDKSPYKTNMGAWITRSGRKSPGPGYYIHLQPGGSFLAAGVYMPEPDQLKKIRNEIYYNVQEFKAILNEKRLRKYCTGLSDMDKGKMAPRDYPKDFPDMELLKYKHYTLSYPFRDEIYYNVQEFKAILNEKRLRKYCTGLSDMDKGKMAPRDYPKDFPDMELLKYKHYTLSYPFRDEMISSGHFTEVALMAFKAMYPLNLFLKRALEG